MKECDYCSTRNRWGGVRALRIFYIFFLLFFISSIQDTRHQQVGVVPKKRAPRTVGILPDVFQGRATTPVGDEKQVGTMTQQDANQVKVGLSRPTRVVKGGAAVIVHDARRNPRRFQQKRNALGVALATCRVKDAFSKSIAALQYVSSIQTRPEGRDIVVANGRDLVHVIRPDIVFGHGQEKASRR